MCFKLMLLNDAEAGVVATTAYLQLLLFNKHSENKTRQSIVCKQDPSRQVVLGMENQKTHSVKQELLGV